MCQGYGIKIKIDITLALATMMSMETNMELTFDTAVKTEVTERTIIYVWSYDVVEAACVAQYDLETGLLINMIPCTSYPVKTGKMVPNPLFERLRETGRERYVARLIEQGRSEMIEETVAVDAPEFQVPEVWDFSEVEV